MPASSKQIANPDVLWEIFSSLASFDQYNSQPLKTLRIVSHVCTSWRQLILSSPLLWARIINVDELIQMTDDWRTEVIRRTGDAVLSIRGTGYRVSAKSERFIVFLLRDNWYRIKYIQIFLSSLSLHRSSVFSQILQTPAPNLEYFAVECGSLETGCPNNRRNQEVEGSEDLVVGGDSWTCHSVSFGGQAPKLKHFSCADLLLPPAEQFCFSQVVHLECGETNGEVLLNALAFMPKIETLHVHIIEDLPNIPIFSPTNIVFLPHLHHVRITTDTVWQVGLTILISLRPCPGFQLEFDVREGQGDITIAGGGDVIKDVLSRFLTDTSGELKEDTLEVKLYGDVFYMFTLDKFRLDFHCWNCVAPLIRILSIPQAAFLQATELNIDIIRENQETDEIIANFFSSLAVAHSLCTNSETLAYIHELSLGYPDKHLLPALKHLELRGYEMGLANMIEEFLGYRRDAYGTPIQSITASGLWGANLCNLERFDGILFRGYFGDTEVCYVCGSGSPETLDFTATAAQTEDPAIRRMEIDRLLTELSSEEEEE
ncbi:hypothetical protein CPC08DRAFT_821759 [Agrocybe pediades]|nr:hypothetical protein CPC08DRAFT_821759 [Agrocybe pediades]